MTIRRQPADFVVRERLSERFAAGIVDKSDNKHTHTVFSLAKTSLATPDAIRYLAQGLGVRPERVSYAGLKDKHAQTTQHVSIDPEPGGSPANVPRGAQGPTWEAHLLGWAGTALTAEAIDGNAFELVVRDLSRPASDEMGRRADVLWCRVAGSAGDHPPSIAREGLLVVNYFGDQRFGGARHHQGWIGRALIDGDFEAALRLAVGTPARKDSGRIRAFTRSCAGKWGDWKALARELPICPERRAFERLATGGDFKQAFVALPYFTQQMAVEAYQSHLWNRTAALLAERLAMGRSGQPSPRDLLHTEDPFGDMLFPAPRRVDDTWRAMDLPLLARKTALEPAWGWAVERVLEQEKLTQAQLRIPGLHRPFYGEAPRPLFVLAERFEMSRSQRDDMDERGLRVMRRVSFDLPRGAYATVVLRAMGQ